MMFFALSNSDVMTLFFALARMVRCEFQILVCVCMFPVDSDRNSVVSIPLDECVQEWELGIFFSFHGELGLGVKAVDVLRKVM